MYIKNQLLSIKEALPKSVELVAVSKTHPAEAVMCAYEAGQRVFGENRPQEMCAKWELLPKDIKWHMIGHLQTNKVRSIAPFVEMIHSVDSERLIQTIDREAKRCNRVIDILLEVHVAEEQSKTGWDFDALKTFVESGAVAQLEGVRERGVMCIATNTDDMERVKSDFRTVASQMEELKPYFDESFDRLSMGMSSDYTLAIECGSNMVRIGSSIFGERDYSK